MQNKNIRLGVVGTNFVSDWLCEAATMLDGVTVEAVYSRTAEKGSAFAEKHAIPNVYTDYDIFLSSDIDAVYIASPNFAHCEQAIRALNAKKHVLCEKVIATNSAELSRMIEASKENQCVLMEAMRPVHDPALALIKEQLPKLGKLRRVVLDYCQYSSRYDKFKAGEILNAFDPTFSNAAVMDIGCYIIHVAALLFGKPQKILSSSVILSNGFEGAGHVILDYGDIKAELSYSKITESVTPNLIVGEDATLSFARINMPHDIKIQYHRGSANYGTSETNVEEILHTQQGNNFIYELGEFARLCRAGAYEHEYLAPSTLAMEIIDEIRAQNSVVFPTDAK